MNTSSFNVFMRIHSIFCWAAIIIYKPGFCKLQTNKNYLNFCNIKFPYFSFWSQYLQFTCTKELFSEAVLNSFYSKVCPVNMQHIYRRKPIRKCDFKNSCLAHLHGCSTVNFLENTTAPFEGQFWGLVLGFILFALVQVKSNTFY